MASGYRYWFGRPIAADLPYNRSLAPAGYLISSAEDMAHYLIAQLNDGRYLVIRPSSLLKALPKCTEPAVSQGEDGSFYGMGWKIGPDRRGSNGLARRQHVQLLCQYDACTRRPMGYRDLAEFLQLSG